MNCASQVGLAHKNQRKGLEVEAVRDSQQLIVSSTMNDL